MHAKPMNAAYSKTICALSIALAMSACGSESDENGAIYGEGGGGGDRYSSNNESWGEPGSAEDGGGEGGEVGEGVRPASGQLTAGRWRDVDNWAMWLKLMDPSGQWRAVTQSWGFMPVELVKVEVVSGQAPAIDAEVVLKDAQGAALWTARTDHAGRAYLFPSFFTGAPGVAGLEVEVGGVTAQVGADGEAVEIDAPGLAAPADTLDVMFAIDVTGSMLDEQSYLRSEMRDVMDRLEDERPDLTIRASMNFYCDPDDEFDVISNPFGPVAGAMDTLDAGASCGGGDYPEGVDEALDDALGHEWSTSARARVLFLVLDAPPHDDQGGLGRLARFAREASARGIKLVPVVSSGSDKPLEFLLRPLVMATNGTYAFLTADSGIGGDKIEPTIGSFEVEYLNELMLDYLLTQTGSGTL